MEMIGITTRYSLKITCPGVTAGVDIDQYDYIPVKDATDHREIAEKVRKIWKVRELYYDEVQIVSQPGYKVHYDVDDRHTQEFRLSITRKTSRSTKYDVELYLGTYDDHTDVICWQESLEDYNEKINGGPTVIKTMIRQM